MVPIFTWQNVEGWKQSRGKEVLLENGQVTTLRTIWICLVGHAGFGPQCVPKKKENLHHRSWWKVWIQRGFGMWFPVGLIVCAEPQCGLEHFPPRLFYSIVGFNCLCVLMPTIFLFCVQPGAHFSSYKSHMCVTVLCVQVCFCMCVSVPLSGPTQTFLERKLPNYAARPQSWLGQFTCLCIRIGRVLFHSFYFFCRSKTSQEYISSVETNRSPTLGWTISQGIFYQVFVRCLKTR